jgi:hypothetical protein
MGITITTNNNHRELVSLYDLAPRDRADFDYITGDEVYAPRLFRYLGQWYDVSEFVRVIPADEITANPFIHRVAKDSPYLAWDGIQTQSAFDAIVVRYVDDQCEKVVVGRATW